jgi:SAM-dependent methyltransferase
MTEWVEENVLRKVIPRALKPYLRYHDRIHEFVISRCGFAMFDGLHPKNVFNYRSEFFVENVDKGDIVIDIACGTGLILKKLSPFIARGYGIELSKQNLKICGAKHSAKNIEYIDDDLFRIDYRNLKRELGYNTAIFSHILEHVEDVPALLSTVDAEKLLICVPSQENWYSQLLIHLSLPYFKDSTHYREYTRSMLRKELSLAGYEIEFLGFNQEGEIVCKAMGDGGE